MIWTAPAVRFSVWRKIAMATWQPRTDPIIWATLDIDAEKLLAYVEDVRSATGTHVTPMDLVGRAGAKVIEALPGLNGRVVFGNFVPSPTIDAFFVVSLRTDPTTGTEAAGTDLSGTVVRRVDEKTPWEIAAEIAQRADRIRHDHDPSFKQAKALAKALPPVLLGPVIDVIGFITESLQLPIAALGMEARPYGSMLISNVGTYGLDSAAAPWPTFCHVPIGILMGAVADKVVAVAGKPTVRPILPLTIGLDHRFIDGYQAATMSRVFREYLADPASFDPVPFDPVPRPTTPRTPRKAKSPSTSR